MIKDFCLCLRAVFTGSLSFGGIYLWLNKLCLCSVTNRHLTWQSGWVTLFQIFHCPAGEDKTASPASPVNLTATVHTFSNPHPLLPLVSLSNCTQPLRSQGKGRLLAPHCLGSRCISIHTWEQTDTHTHTSAGTQVFTQQIKWIVALPPT